MEESPSILFNVALALRSRVLGVGSQEAEAEEAEEEEAEEAEAGTKP